MLTTVRANTFSIVARDPQTGKICVAGTSHWFAYATLVPFIEAEVGAIATQAECNLAYGKQGLAFLKTGLTPTKVVEHLTSKDEGKEIRQLLVMDNHGNCAAFTGKDCVKYASHHTEKNFAVAGNMLATNEVISAMVDNFQNSKGELEDRVMQTLLIGQNAGGDLRGKRSAGLLSAEGKISGNFWEGIIYNLRVDDNPDPLAELRRLYQIATAYKFMNQGDNEYYENKNKSVAKEAYKRAAQLMPKNPEAKFWYAKLLWDMGEKAEAQIIMDDVKKTGPQWTEYWLRIVGENI